MTAIGACAREPVAPPTAPVQLSGRVARAEVAPLVPVAVLLDSFAIGGVYAVLPRGGYAGGSVYARSPAREQYADDVRGHPTGLQLPVGLPVRILAAGSYTSHSTAAFQQDYCATHGASEPICGIDSFTYTVHGLAYGPGVIMPYEAGTGLRLAWSRTAGYNDQFYAGYPTAEFFRGLVPALDTVTVRELHFRRAGCCYYIPWGTSAAWETYEGSWRFGVVPDDGGQAELGVPPVLRLLGPRTDEAMAAPATFSVVTTTGDGITAMRWWFVRAANNVFDGAPVPLVTITQPWPMQIPRYPDGQRTVFEEIAACAGQATCTYQPSAAGAVVVQAKLSETMVLAARNTGATGAHVKITADETTITYGDTTVFRVTVPGAPNESWTVTGISFSPLASTLGSSLRAVRENVTLRATKSASAARQGRSSSALNSGRRPTGGRTERAVPARTLRPVPFRDAAYSCGDATIRLCYDDPRVSGYEIVTAVVGGATQRDSVLITVLPKLMLTCKNANGETDANGGTTVVRAQRVSCRASLAPAGSTESIIVSDWTFVSPDRWIVRQRSEVDPTFGLDSLSWTGPMVATGLVTVSGTIGGSSSDSASARITVRPRPWTGDSIPKFPRQPLVVGQGWLPLTPHDVHDLGQTRYYWSTNATLIDDRYRAMITDGPNAYVFYLDRMPPVLDSIFVAYNQSALSRNSAFYLAQEPDNPARVFTAANPCYRSDVVSTDTKDKILAHEGTKWELNPVSHAGRMRQLAFARVPSAAESVFVDVGSGGVQGLMDRWHVLVHDSVEVKLDMLAKKPVDQANPVFFGAGSRGCTFVFPRARSGP